MMSNAVEQVHVACGSIKTIVDKISHVFGSGIARTKMLTGDFKRQASAIEELEKTFASA